MKEQVSMERTESEAGVAMGPAASTPSGSVASGGLGALATEPRGLAVPAARGPVYAALDLGTNNCRLLIARGAPADADIGAFRVVDSFCRIVRLGEGVAASGRLSEAAMARTIEAMKICRERMHARHVTRSRLIATEACRAAANGEAFLARVALETGLKLEIIDRETEALLAAAGCCSLADPEAEGVVLFDIGGGSSEIVWLARGTHASVPGRRDDHAVRQRVRAWESLPLGVVTLAETFGGRTVSAATFEAMVDFVEERLESFAKEVAAEPRCGRFHLLGTSGTVTTIAGVHLGLTRYDRRKVDGLWMSNADMSATIDMLRAMPFEERALNGCIGPDRADLVLAGCAILDAIRRAFPLPRLRVADRGLREGMLRQLAAQIIDTP
jgi:exopolyphosphatase / guanosine-5'-triphosphate,3'-diphosphate pyrophosphatase